MEESDDDKTDDISDGRSRDMDIPIQTGWKEGDEEMMATSLSGHGMPNEQQDGHGITGGEKIAGTEWEKPTGGCWPILKGSGN